MKRFLQTALLHSARLQWCLFRLGALAGRLGGERNPSGLFFIFKSYGIGGAEWVHKEIVQAVDEQRPWVIFTHAQSQVGYLSDYRAAAGQLLDITPAYPYRWRRLLALGRIAGMINRHPSPTVFGSLSPFFYELLPYLKPHVRRIDLTHNFDGFREFQQTPYTHHLDTRVTISESCASEMRALYRQYGIPEEYDRRIRVIPNGIAVPAVCPDKRICPPLKVLFVGRGTNAGKRVFLIGRLAKSCAEHSLPVAFTLVGPRVKDCIETDCQSLVHCPGETTDPASLAAYYAESHVLLMTSQVEGFPVAIMEAMAHGAIPVTTDVGAIPEHVDAEVGFLLTEKDEGKIVEAAVAALETLLSDPERRKTLSRQAHARARERFDITPFRAAYRTLLLGGA